MIQVEPCLFDTGSLHAFERELNNLDIGLEAGVSEDFGTDLQQLAIGQQTGWPRMQHRTAVTQASHPLAVEKVRIDTRDLWSHVGPHTQGATRQLIHQLEGSQVEVAART